MIWTDPPYGVEYVGKTKDALTIQNDSPDGVRELLVAAWQAVTPVLIESAPFYVAGPTGPTGEDFQASFREADWRYQQTLIWVKQRLVQGHQNYQHRHEAIYHGHGPGRNAGRVTPDRFRWYGDDSATSVIEVPAPTRSPDHPTTKPTALITPGIMNSSRRARSCSTRSRAPAQPWPPPTSPTAAHTSSSSTPPTATSSATAGRR